MALLNFQKQFADLIEAGTKRQTIRAARKYPIKVGDKLYLYTGLRTKYCRKLKTKFDKIDEKGKTFVICKSVQDIIIEPEFMWEKVLKENITHYVFRGNIVLDNIHITQSSGEEDRNAIPLAEADGFKKYKGKERIYNLDNFYEYFYRNYGSSFKGQLIKW